MILSGKDLFVYRINQIKRAVLMVTSVAAMVSFMLLMCAVYG